jgi:hypothetical protein
VKFIDNGYGASSLYRMLDAEGNVFKWFSSSGILDDMISETVTIIGTVKGHGEWKGVAETSLTRCKLVK